MAVSIKKLPHDCSWPKCNLIRNYVVLVDGHPSGEYCEVHAKQKASNLRARLKRKKGRVKR